LIKYIPAFTYNKQDSETMGEASTAPKDVFDLRIAIIGAGN